MRSHLAVGVLVQVALVAFGCESGANNEGNTAGQAADTGGAGGGGGQVTSSTSTGASGNDSDGNTASQATSGATSTVAASGSAGNNNAGGASSTGMATSSAGAGGTSLVQGDYSIDFIEPLIEHQMLFEQRQGDGAVNVEVAGVLPDETVVVGTSTLITSNLEEFVDVSRAFRWTREGGSVSLGTLHGDDVTTGRITVDSMSPDGRVIVGRAPDADGVERVYRWTESTGMVALAGVSSGRAMVSADGSTIAVTVGGFEDLRAQRWREASGVQVLDFMGADASHIVLALSDDGSIVYGYTSSSEGWQAFRYSDESGMQPLPTPEGYQNCSLVGGPNVSHGGALIGRCTSPDRAFVYTEAAGFVDLGTLVGFSRYDPWSVSLAGDVVFGDAGNEPGEPTTVFRYAAETGMEALGTFEGQTSSTHRPGVRGIARDGSVAIGDWYDATGNYPYIWDATGIRTLPAPAGFPFASVHAVHPDGVFVAGATQVHIEPFVSEAVLWNLDATPRLLAQELESAGIDLGETNLQAVDAFAPSGTIVGGAQRGEGYYLRFLARVP